MSLFLIFILIFIIIIFYTIKQEQKRTESIKNLADSLGFTFNPKPLAGDYPVEPFQLFDIGHSKRFSNGMTQKKMDITISMFEYFYTTGSGKNSTTYRQTVTLFSSPHLKLPQFALKPEGLFQKIGEMFGAKDIDFEDSPEFSKKYQLKSAFEDETRKTFRKEIRDFLSDKTNYSIEGNGTNLLIHSGRRIDTALIPEVLQERTSLFQLFNKKIL
jgi:hypothetical protein